MKIEKTMSINISNDEIIEEMTYWSIDAQINFIKKLMTDPYYGLDVDNTLSLIVSLLKAVCKEVKNGEYAKNANKEEKKKLNAEIAKITEAITNFIDFCNNPECI